MGKPSIKSRKTSRIRKKKKYPTNKNNKTKGRGGCRSANSTAGFQKTSSRLRRECTLRNK